MVEEKRMVVNKMSELQNEYEMVKKQYERKNEEGDMNEKELRKL